MGKITKIDTSIEGYKHIGINLSQSQLNDLLIINTMMKEDTGKDIPVHCVLLTLKMPWTIASRTYVRSKQ